MELDSLRTQLDVVDEQLLELVLQRQSLVQQIGVWKKEHHVPALQPEQYQHKRAAWLTWAQTHGLSRTLATDLWETLHTASIEEQEKVGS